MLDEPRFAEQAQNVALQISREDGVKTACDALEALFARTRPEALFARTRK